MRMNDLYKKNQINYLIFKFMRVCYLNDYFFFSSVYSIIYIGETKKEKRKR